MAYIKHEVGTRKVREGLQTPSSIFHTIFSIEGANANAYPQQYQDNVYGHPQQYH